MAAFPICSKTPYKDQNLQIQSAIRNNDKRFMYDCDNRPRDSLHKRGKLFTVCSLAESSNINKQLRSLESYFGKLQDNTKLRDSVTSNEVMKVHQRDGELRLKNGLESLDEYLDKLNNGKV